MPKAIDGKSQRHACYEKSTLTRTNSDTQGPTRISEQSLHNCRMGDWIATESVARAVSILPPARGGDPSVKASDIGPTGAVPIVFVVDADASVRDSLESLINNVGCEAETFATAKEFLSRQRVAAPNCLVLDVALPDINGLDLQMLVADRVEMPIIFITGLGDVPTTVRAMKAGATEFLTKPCDYDVLLSAIRSALDRSNCLLREEAEMRLLLNRCASLTPREREVMHLVVAGELNKQIAGDLKISEITVKAHRGKMMRKMRAGSLAALVNLAEKFSPPSAPIARDFTYRLFWKYAAE